MKLTLPNSTALLVCLGGVAVGCNGTNGAPVGQPSASGPEAVGLAIDRSIPVDRETRLQLRTVPNAACVLAPVSEPSTELKLFADDAGFVQVHVRLDSSAAATTSMNFRCAGTTGSLATMQVLQLHPADSNAPMPVDDAALDSEPAAPGAMRPALTGDPLGYSDEQLAAGGYPLRPNPNSAPAAFQHWLTSVSRPLRRVPARLISRPDLSNGPVIKATTSNAMNWSGVEVKHIAYAGLQGSWTVPTVTGDTSSSNTQTFSVEWIGVDGDGTTDLVQDGSGQNAIRTSGVMVASYFGWVEYVPNVLQQLSGFTVNVGDALYSQVYAGDSVGNLNPSGGYGWFYIENDSRGTYSYTSIAKPMGAAAFTGVSAEWIMERPGIGVPSQLPELAKYSCCPSLSNAYAIDSSSTFYTYGSQSPFDWKMIGCTAGMSCTGFSSNTLATVSETNSTVMQFTWYHFQ